MGPRLLKKMRVVSLQGLRAVLPESQLDFTTTLSAFFALNKTETAGAFISCGVHLVQLLDHGLFIFVARVYLF